MYLLTLLSVYCCALWFGTVASSLSYFRINPLSYVLTYFTQCLLLCIMVWHSDYSSLSYFRINRLYLCTYLLYSVFIVVHYGLAQWLAPRLTLE